MKEKRWLLFVTAGDEYSFKCTSFSRHTFRVFTDVYLGHSEIIKNTVVSEIYKRIRKEPGISSVHDECIEFFRKAYNAELPVTVI